MRLDPEQAGHDRQSLASALRNLRRASGLSGERLARRCHMSQSKVSRIENGRLLPSVVDVKALDHSKPGAIRALKDRHEVRYPHGGGCRCRRREHAGGA